MSQPQFETNFDFDASSKAWRANKIKCENGTYKYKPDQQPKKSKKSKTNETNEQKNHLDMLPGNILKHIYSFILETDEDHENTDKLISGIAFMKATGARRTSDWESNIVPRFTRSFPQFK